ncbi:MAG: hypothetical protein R6T78_01250 [Dehalococcoidales bacterium]
MGGQGLKMISLRELFDKMCTPVFPDGKNTSTYLPDEDDGIDVEKEAEIGLSLGNKVDSLIQELVRIGWEEGFVEPGYGQHYDEEGRNIRARNIGKRLDEIGGLRLMKVAWWRVRFDLSPGPASRDLDIIWDGVGEWRG